ncbi:hypothetical protein, partial [Bacillus paralicheniformis]
MPAHVFVDETKARGVVLTAITLLPCNLAMARKVMRGFVMPAQRRIHFVHESDAPRKQILDGIAELEPSAAIYDAGAWPRRQQREACLRALVADLAVLDAELLVLERDDSIVTLDNRILYQRVRELGCDRLRYAHMRAH